MNRGIPPSALAALLSAMVLWASSFIVLKIAYQSYEPMFVIFGRMVVAATCFLLFSRSLKKNTYRRGDWKIFVLMGFLDPCSYFFLEGWALSYTTASQAGMIIATIPLFVAIFARLFLNEYLTKRTLFGFLLAVCGTIWLSASNLGNQSASNPMLGNILEISAAACAAGFTVLIKKMSAHYTPLFLTAFQAFVGTFFFFPIMLLSGEGLPGHFDLTGMSSIIFLGIGVTMGAYGFFNYSISRIPANQAASFGNLIPVFTVIMSYVFLGERLNSQQYLGSILVLGGVFISQDPRSRGPKDKNPAGLEPRKEAA